MEQKPYHTSMEEHHRWSSLPEEIIIKIISHINLLRDTVITISTTNFSIKQRDKPIDNVYEYWNILDNIFILFAPPVIDTFCLDLYVYHKDELRCWPIIETRACQLRSRNVQHMKLSRYEGFGYFDLQLNPPRIFLFDSLVTLEVRFLSLGRHIDWRLPNSLAVPNLKKLYLSALDYAYLGKLLSYYPSLEDLSVSLDDNNQKIVILITSKSLKRLYINLMGKSMLDVIIDTPKLEELGYCSNSLLSMRMLDSISNLKSLKLTTGSPMRFNNRLTTLSELIRLELCLSSGIYQAIFDQQLMHCPNLEVLVLTLLDNYDIVWNQEATFMLVQQVNRIELHTNDKGVSKYVLNLGTWLLRSAPVLKKLVISGYGTPRSHDSLSKFRNTLLKCAEDTSGCQIDFLGGYEL